MARWTRRLADSLRAPWIALHVDTGRPLGRPVQERLATNLALARELGKKWSVAYALNNLGLAACDQDDWRAAERFFAEALQTAMEAEAPPRALDALGAVGLLRLRQAIEGS